MKATKVLAILAVFLAVIASVTAGVDDDRYPSNDDNTNTGTFAPNGDNSEAYENSTYTLKKVLFFFLMLGVFGGGGYWSLVVIPGRKKAVIMAARDAKVIKERRLKSASECGAIASPLQAEGGALPPPPPPQAEGGPPPPPPPEAV